MANCMVHMVFTTILKKEEIKSTTTGPLLCPGVQLSVLLCTRSLNTTRTWMCLHMGASEQKLWVFPAPPPILKSIVILHGYIFCWNNYMCQTQLRLIQSHSYKGWPGSLKNLEWILWDQNPHSRSVSPKPRAIVGLTFSPLKFFAATRLWLPTPFSKGGFPLSTISSW